MNVIRSLYDNCTDSASTIKLDFSAVKLMRSDGMLVLLAHIEILCSVYPRRIKARCPAGSLAAQLLHWFNFGNLLGVSERQNKPRDATVTGWQFFHGTKADGEKVGAFLTKLRDVHHLRLPEHLYDALVESLTNVSNHAYPAEAPDLVPSKFQRWWLFANFAAPKGIEPGHLSIAVFDVGVGIIEHMKHRFKFGELIIDKTAWLLERFGASTRVELDMKLLKETIEEGKSSTRLPHRGNGLPEMVEFTIGTERGEFQVLTNGIHYSRHANRTSSTMAKSAVDTLGTLLCWYVPLSATPMETE